MNTKFKRFFTIFLVGLSCVSYAQIREGDKWLNPKAVLNYNVTDSANFYTFIADNFILENNISFQWKMLDPVNYTGKVTITKEALESSMNVVSDFKNKSDDTYSDKSTIFLSKKIFNALKDKKAIKINVDGIEQTLSFKNLDKIWVQKASTGLQLNVLYAETEKGTKIWVLDSKTYPLIVKMASKLTLELTSVLPEEK